MVTVILAQLRRRAGRTAALFVGVLTAAVGFTVLAGSTATSQLRVRGAVSEHSRGAYDVLVRPAGARTALEEQRGLVRANFLAGQYGGITVGQWRSIQALSGVEVAAPIAMLGYATTLITTPIDITDAVEPALTTQLIRVRLTWRGDRDLSRAPDMVPSTVYVTRRTVLTSDVDGLYSDGVRRPAYPCGTGSHLPHPPYEVQPGGAALPLCYAAAVDSSGSRATAAVAQLTPRNTFVVDGVESAHLSAEVGVPMALLAAGIDPVAESALVGLEKAVISGRYLTGDEPILSTNVAPVLMADEPYLDESLEAVPETVANPGLAGADDDRARVILLETRAGPAMPSRSRPVGDIYRDTFGEPGPTRPLVQFALMLRPQAVSYDTGADGTLLPVEVPSAADAWQATTTVSAPMPWLANDSAQRATAPPQPEVLGRLRVGQMVGAFDPSRLNTGDRLATALETYVQAQAVGSDDGSRRALGGRPLLPTSNPGGYLVASPTVLVALNTLLQAGLGTDAISAIRVRVTGVVGFDSLSRERVRLVAEEIARTTGLDVEVMLGASGAPQTVSLGAGRFGRPSLLLDENWSQKGVAAAVVQAVDRKSIILFGLILGVCVLFLANAAAAAVRERRRELAILACLGWSRRQLGGLFAGEVALVGLGAGVIAATTARPLGDAVGIGVSATRAWLAVPMAVGLCLLAAAVPAVRASRAHPAAAIQPAVTAPRGRYRRPHRLVSGMAVANLRRTPGRTVLGALSLAVGVGGLTLVTAVTWAFHGTVTGTMLGDAISIRVRGVDVVAVVATILIGSLAVADVLYLNVRDRAAEFATLLASGWSDAALSRLIAYEALAIGLFGGVTGGGISVWAAAQFVGTVTPALVLTATISAIAGAVMAVLASVVPMTLRRRVPMSILLAEE